VRRWIFAVVGLLAAAGLAAWFWALQNKTVKAVRELAPKLKDVEIQAEVDVDLSLKGIELSQGKAGQLHWRLKAKRANYTQDRAEVLVENPEIEYYYEKDNRTFKVMATHGALQQGQDTARLWPDVRGAYEGNELRADELVYTGKDRTLTLSGQVTIEGPKLRFKAPELKYILSTNEILVEKGVSAVVMVPATGSRFGVLRVEPESKGASGASNGPHSEVGRPNDPRPNPSSVGSKPPSTPKPGNSNVKGATLP
jgi:LPS export ABC transporter protein LptC